MEQQSSVEILRSIAKREDWDIEIKEKKINQRHGHTERYAIIRNRVFPGSIFLSAQTTNLSNYRIYSGIFTPLSINYDYKLLIRKRDVLDKLKFRKDKLRFKIGNSSFDSQVFVETNNDIQTHKLLSNAKVQSEIIDFLSLSDRLLIGFDEIYPKIKEATGKKYFSVFISMEWMLETNLINEAFKLNDLLINKFNIK